MLARHVEICAATWLRDLEKDRITYSEFNPTMHVKCKELDRSVLFDSIPALSQYKIIIIIWIIIIIIKKGSCINS